MVKRNYRTPDIDIVSVGMSELMVGSACPCHGSCKGQGNKCATNNCSCGGRDVMAAPIMNLSLDEDDAYYDVYEDDNAYSF